MSTSEIDKLRDHFGYDPKEMSNEVWVVFVKGNEIYSMNCEEEHLMKIPGDIVYLGEADDNLWSLVKESRRARDDEEMDKTLKKLREAIRSLEGLAARNVREG